tara:strand:+ start:2728 stop:3468 length:741 start_codon:yes stop_codon:yes gene_type:complete
LKKEKEMNHKTTAPLKNVLIFNELADRVINRPSHLSALAAFTGFSGYGKTTAAIFAANKIQAHYIEAGLSWSQGAFLDALCTELGLPVMGTIAKKTAAIVENLAVSGRPLIIDEFDFIIKKNYVDLVREIHDKSDAPIIIIGEELMPSKLESFERFHNRVFSWVQAQPADLQDTDHLRRLYYPKLEVSEDLLTHLLEINRGCTSRIVNNFEQISEHANILGINKISLSDVKDLTFFTGKAPARRAS